MQQILLADAKTELERGAEFGSVYPYLSAVDRARLLDWYMSNPRVPNIEARKRKSSSSTGETCKKCLGSNFIQSGTCKTCADCGESGGCG